MNAVEQMTPYVAEKYSAEKIVDEVVAHWDKLQLVKRAAAGNFRENIVAIEKMIAGCHGAFFGDTDNCPLTHKFANGIYVREIFIPATTLYVSRIHKFDHPRILLSGELTTATEFDGLQRMRGPVSMICRAGTKRVGYAHSDCRIVTIHNAEEGAPDVIMRRLYCDTYEEFDIQRKELKP